MTDEAEFECQTKFPFVSLMDNIPLEPELKGLPNPEEIDKFLTKMRKKRAKHLNSLSSNERVHHKSNIYDELEKFSKCFSDDLVRASDKHEGVLYTEEEPAGYGALEFICVFQNKIMINVIQFWAKIIT